MMISGHVLPPPHLPANGTPGRPGPGGRGVAAVRVLAALAVGVIVGLLVLAVWDLHQREPAEVTGLAKAVGGHMDRSGVDNPVTAVLLNFRSYDTLLEIGVLLLGAMAVVALRRRSDVGDVPRDKPPGAVLGWLVRLGIPVLVLVAGYLLWLGSRWPGGAFQAGAVLGAAGVMLRLAGWESAAALRGLKLRAGLALGFTAFALVGVAVMAVQGRLLEYPERWATVLIVAVEALAAVSIGLTLAMLFVAGEIGESGSGNGHRDRYVREER